MKTIRYHDHDRAPSDPAILFRYHDDWPGLWLGTRGRINRRIPRARTRYCTVTSLFFDMSAWRRVCISTVHVHLHPTCTPPAPRPFIEYSNVRAECLGKCCKKATKIEEERKPTELTESNLLAGHYCHRHSSHRHLMIYFGPSSMQTHYLLQSPGSWST
jgi:hypothetical protein